ncbi:YciI family protein [Paenibacillus ehimensis]|uniref:YciI family protein n=1 Tax=Paenibacillus ehimensis TaxID=79264 RepID=A0ABT8V463_9BACL|nr:YciI family protein [Paenibacillus ehimensis]MDO3676226.1 YciI family protein [Paenibacillus ehimensis]
MTKFTRYVILLSLNSGKRLTEDLIRKHIAFLRKLEQNGQLELCGPLSDYEGGMVIIRASSCEEARSVAESGPFVSTGTESYELRAWQLSCEENNHLGAG